MDVKMVITLPLAIILFISGVYCPRTGLPSEYSLLSCESDSELMKLHLVESTFEFYCNDPVNCCLIETHSGGEKNMLGFRRTSVEFISMEDARLNMMIYYPESSDVVEWGLKCEFQSTTLARQFHRLITSTQNRIQPMHFLKGEYLKTSNDVVLAQKPDLYLDGFKCNITVVVKNEEGDAVVIIPKSAISEVIKRGSTQIDLKTNTSGGGRQLYKFGFSTPAHAAAWNRVLNKLRNQRISTKYHAVMYRRLHRDPSVDAYLAEIEQERPR